MLGNRPKYVIALIVLLVIFGPVIIRQLLPAEPRSLERVALKDTTFTEVTFRNAAQDIDLAGLLFVPEGQGPFPAAVIIHGSGTSRRDNGWYLTLTKFLQENGIAVLLPDKRGSEKSGGDWHTASFEDLATDTLAALEFLRGHETLEFTTLGVVGMSQGGWIAPIVATRSADVDFVVNMVGSAVTPDEQFAYEENLNLRQMGFLPGISNAVSVLSTAWIRNVAQQDFWDAIDGFDPLPYWQDVEVGTLVLYGGGDTNVPSRESAARLYDLRKPNIRVSIYEGSGHALEDPPEYGNSLIRYDVLEAIGQFIQASELD
jgi:dienelactone hydrolase